MTEKAVLAEVGAITVAYQLALARLGISSLAKALSLWSSVPAGQDPTDPDSVKWLGNVVTMAMGQRKLSIQLARAYYRLITALLTDHTVGNPGDTTETSVSVGQLRSEFTSLAKEPQAYNPASYHEVDDATTVPVTHIADLSEVEKATEKAARQEAALDLAATGPDRQHRQVQKLNPKQPAKTVDTQRNEIHDKAGSRTASNVERIVYDGGRDTVTDLVQHHSAALGWARVSTSGTPCAFCSMLISRGIVYKTESSASGQWHNNCHCIAVPVLSQSQYDNDPMFSLNRDLSSQWQRLKEQHGGVTTSIWRKYIDQRFNKRATQRAA